MLTSSSKQYFINAIHPDSNRSDFSQYQKILCTIIKFAFEKLILRRIENRFFVGNKASEKMQKKLGYKIEGLRRKSLICLADGKYKNEYITGLLKEDWIKKMKSKKEIKK